MFGRSKARSDAKIDISNLLTKVDESREQIAVLRSERETVARAPRPLAETLTLLDAHLDVIATQAVDGFHLGGLLRRDQSVALRLPFRFDAETRSVDTTGAVNAMLGLLVATCRPALRQIIEGQLSDLLQDRPALTDQEQAARLSELDRQILTTELHEERCIRQLEAAGLPVLRRPDAAPLALLAADTALPALS